MLCTGRFTVALITHSLLIICLCRTMRHPLVGHIGDIVRQCRSPERPAATGHQGADRHQRAPGSATAAAAAAAGGTAGITGEEAVPARRRSRVAAPAAPARPRRARRRSDHRPVTVITAASESVTAAPRRPAARHSAGDRLLHSEAEHCQTAARRNALR